MTIPFHIYRVFIDADKKKYIDYMKQIMGEDEESSLLNHGALVVVDNTLWKGLVLQHVSLFAHYYILLFTKL